MPSALRSMLITCSLYVCLRVTGFFCCLCDIEFCFWDFVEGGVVLVEFLIGFNKRRMFSIWPVLCRYVSSPLRSRGFQKEE